ncbi:hypothetical protein SEUCBS140593_002637 [Sporothrix eucalyptigena]|uniref:Inner centromere protein ARK-binding domain-containing protein n=1 Tax=Sporothrix eucalyptigena TaxID=1812306 RepID=A0ABP0B8E5_9PEZI
MAMRGPRHPIGAAPWIVEERTTALHIAQSEVEEFMFSAKNELDWLNEHMAEIFSENQINVADIFKTPGKLRGKTPRTARKTNKGDIRAPLTDVFSSTPKGAPNPFAVSKLTSLQQQQRRQSPTFTVAEDKPAPPRKSQSPQRVIPAKTITAAKTKAAAAQKTKAAAPVPAATFAKPTREAPSLVDSGYHGSQSQDAAVDYDEEDELAGDMSTQPFSQPTRPATPEAITRKPVSTKAAAKQKGAAPESAVAAPSPVAAVAMSPDEMADHPSPTQPTVEPTFHSAKEEQTAVVPAAMPEAAKPCSPAADTEVLSSSPFCPVQSPSSVIAEKIAPSAKPMASASPKRKPVPAPSSPLQSTTPACPPPRELLSAMGISAIPAASSPAIALVSVPPAVPTPPMASVPAFIAEKRAAVTAAWEEKEDEEDVVVYEEDAAIDEVVEDRGNADQNVLQPRQDVEEEEEEEEAEDPPSPVRPIVRKSSMNFASLPARAPFTSNKSLGAGAGLARAGQAEPTRTSYYNRPTGGKSLGNVRAAEPEGDEDRDDEMNIDGQNTTAHNKTYAQRLHDRISMLGKSQANAPRSSKSLAAFAQQQEAHHAAQQKAQQTASLSPKRAATSIAAPGAFPEDEDDDDDDDWIDPPPTAAAVASPPSNTAKDVAAAANVVDETTEFVLPKQRQQDASRLVSPKKVQAPIIPERTTSAITVPTKSSSVPSLPTADSTALTTTKPISVSNPTNPTHVTLASVSELEDRPTSPSKSPSRNYRDSPLKHVKNKLSSILKTSKGLLASSAALSAEGKSSLLSPSTTRLGLLMGPSTESLALKHQNDSASDLSRPDLSRQTSATTTVSTTSAASAASSSVLSGTADIPPAHESPVRSESPSRPRKTRASTERERREQKHREKELKEVQRMAEQMGKLEKMREKEREKARVFVEDQEKIAAAAAEKPAPTPAPRELRGQKNPQSQPQPQPLQPLDDDDDDMDILSQPPPSKTKPQPSSPARVAAKPTRTSPRKAKAQQADDDVDMADAPTSMLPPPPPAHSTVPTSSTVPRSAQGTRTIRRPIKPTKEAPAKTKQAPTVIRVNTSSSQHQQQQAQFHPSNSILAASLHETLVGPPQLKNKASTASLHTKPSLQSLKSSVSSTGRPKALELAAKRKEAEEREAQRKRDAKAEIERKRAALQEQEERRQEQQRQKEREREQAQAEAAAAKKAAAAQAQRQAAIEKAKQTRAPPPVQRTQLPSGPSADYGRSEAQPPRPQSRLATAAGSTMHRSQEEQHRPVNAVLSHTAKALSKRPLPGADAYESQNHGRPGPAGGNAGGSNMPSYQHKDAKRIRMSEEFDEDELEMGGHGVRVSSIKGPPVRPSNGFKKELPNKSVFGNSYATAPANVSRDLFKSTVTAQHNNQSRAGHPMDMAQVSKAAISFAPSGNNSTASAAAAAAAASTSAPQGTHKTPLRPAGTQLAGKSAAKSAGKSVGKSAAKSSPRFPNGDAIELPDIQTDDEDSEEEHVNAAPWADSPDLRRALMRQETVDPFQVFGPPGPLIMEEVFNKTKERWHKFRARTSSANWSGIDRLTEDDIRKDLAARDKIRREGGWSYELGKDML